MRSLFGRFNTPIMLRSPLPRPDRLSTVGVHESCYAALGYVTERNFLVSQHYDEKPQQGHSKHNQMKNLKAASREQV
jgi:hypothetical protein